MNITREELRNFSKTEKQQAIYYQAKVAIHVLESKIYTESPKTATRQLLKTSAENLISDLTLIECEIDSIYSQMTPITPRYAVYLNTRNRVGTEIAIDWLLYRIQQGNQAMFDELDIENRTLRLFKTK